MLELLLIVGFILVVIEVIKLRTTNSEQHRSQKKSIGSTALMIRV